MTTTQHYIGVDVGGTKILAGASTAEGEILARHKERTERDSTEKIVAQIGGAIEAAMDGANLKIGDIGGIALGVPGVVETASGFVVFTPNAPLSGVPLGDLLRERFAVPITVGNDVDIGVVGETWLGAAREAHSAFGIFVGTGIGGGLVINDQLIEGFRGLGGEIGHFMIPLDADAITGILRRKHTFLEDLCSRTAIENQLRHAILHEKEKSDLVDIVGDKKLRRIRSKHLKEAIKRDDKVVMEVLRRTSYLLGLATASVLHVVDPEVIIFGGGVIEACGDFMLPLIEKTARKVAMPGTGQPLNIVRSQLGDDAIVLGGVALLNEKVPPPHRQTSRSLLKAHGDSQAPRAQVDKPLSAEK